VGLSENFSQKKDKQTHRMGHRMGQNVLPRRIRG